MLIIKYSDDADKIFYIFTSEMDKTIEYRGIIPNCHLKDEDTYGGKIKFSYKFIPQNTDYSNFTLKVF